MVAALSRDVVFGRVAAGTYALASLSTPRRCVPCHELLASALGST